MGEVGVVGSGGGGGLQGLFGGGGGAGGGASEPLRMDEKAALFDGRPDPTGAGFWIRRFCADGAYAKKYVLISISLLLCRLLLFLSFLLFFSLLSSYATQTAPASS